jgi:hypothetical protein
MTLWVFHLSRLPGQWSSSKTPRLSSPLTPRMPGVSGEFFVYTGARNRGESATVESSKTDWNNNQGRAQSEKSIHKTILKGESKMRTKLFTLFVLFVALATLSTGCDSLKADASTDVPPEKVVESFYEWVLDYRGDPATGEVRNMLVDKAYRDSEHLSGAFIEKVDGIIASFETQPGGGYDPFLCAQDWPGAIRSGDVTTAGDTATVTVQQVWNPDTQFESIREITAKLQKIDGEWKISDILCQ